MSLDPSFSGPIPSDLPHPPGAPAAPGLVTDDIPCRKCSYNLRGLPLDGRCPECGAAVGLSTYGDLLRYSDPGWVLNLQRGAMFILAGIFVVIAGVILVVVLGFVFGVQGNAGALTGGSFVILSGLASLAGYALIVVGSWLLTEPDPSGLGEDQYGTSRKLIRITLALGVLNSLLEFGSNVAPPPPGLMIPFQVLSFLLGVAGVVGMFAQLQYLKKLALRIPDDHLARRAQFLMYAIGISYGLLLAVGLVVGITAAGGGTGMGPVAVLGCFAAITGLALLVFGIMYLLMIDGFRRRFGQEARAAQATWAGVGRPQTSLG